MHEHLTPPSEIERLDAERFEDALLATELGLDPQVHPLEDPELTALLDTTRQLREAMVRTSPRPGYRTRSRALLMDAAEPGFLRRVARVRARIPFYDRRSFLVPFASAAAAAGITIAVMLAADVVGGSADAPATADTPALAAVAQTEAPAAVAEPNLTQISIRQDLDRLRASLDSVLAAAGRGDEVDPSVLRSIASSNLMVTTFLEASPDRMRTDEVILYYQQAAEVTIRLDELAAFVADQPALMTARSSSELGVGAAAAHLSNVQATLAAGQPLQ